MYKKIIEFIKSVAWDRVAMLSTAGAILIYVDWRIAAAVALLMWAIIAAMNELVREQGRTDHNMAHLLMVHRGGLIEMMDRIKKLERNAGEDPPHVH